MLKKLVFGLAVLLAGSVIYANGSGLFWPCEALGRLYNGGACTRILDLPDRPISAVARAEDSHVLLTLDPPENNPDLPLRLVDLWTAGDAHIIGEVDLKTEAPSGSVVAMAVNADGSRIAISIADGDIETNSVQIFDRRGNRVGAINPSTPSHLAFRDDNSLLVYPYGVRDSIPIPAFAEVYDLANPDRPPTKATAAELTRLFGTGHDRAYSPDGQTFVRAMDQLDGSPIVGLSLKNRIEPDAPDLLLGASLGTYCGGPFPISFNPDPDVKRLMASLGCFSSWGQVSSTLLAWDYSAGSSQVLLDLPTITAFDHMVWLYDFQLLAVRYDSRAHRAEVFKIALPE